MNESILKYFSEFLALSVDQVIQVVNSFPSINYVVKVIPTNFTTVTKSVDQIPEKQKQIVGKVTTRKQAANLNNVGSKFGTMRSSFSQKHSSK